jgi:hypothetical protein
MATKKTGINTALFTPKGQWLTEYALANGYIEKFDYGNRFVTMQMVEKPDGSGIQYQIETWTNGKLRNTYTRDTVELARRAFAEAISASMGTTALRQWNARPMRGQHDA